MAQGENGNCYPFEIEARQGGIEEFYPLGSGEAARRMYETGDLQAGTVLCSQGIGLIRDIKPVREVLQEMVAQTAAIKACLPFSD